MNARAQSIKARLLDADADECVRQVDAQHSSDATDLGHLVAVVVIGILLVLFTSSASCKTARTRFARGDDEERAAGRLLVASDHAHGTLRTLFAE